MQNLIKKLLEFSEQIKDRNYSFILTGYLLIIVLACSPIIMVVIAGFLGKCLDCNINEAGTDNCVVLGIPLGMILNPMMAAGWFALLTIPMGIVALAVWTVHCIIILIRNSRNNKIQ